MKLRVMIVDDHRMFREALQYILARDPTIEVVAAAANGAEALERAAETRPDIVCMDIHMRGLNGIETTRRLLAAQPAARVIALSAYSNKEYALEMCEAGAVGYVTKEEAGEELMRAIHAAAHGKAYFSPEIIASNVVPADATVQRYSPMHLDSREQEVLSLLTEGYTHRQIAQHLLMEEWLVEAYRKSILLKMGLNTEANLGDCVPKEST